MDVWKYEIISRVEQDISHLFALLIHEISWSTLQCIIIHVICEIQVDLDISTVYHTVCIKLLLNSTFQYFI